MHAGDGGLVDSGNLIGKHVQAVWISSTWLRGRGEKRSLPFLHTEAVITLVNKGCDASCDLGETAEQSRHLYSASRGWQVAERQAFPSSWKSNGACISLRRKENKWKNGEHHDSSLSTVEKAI
jgi:hypothetical protein